MRQFIAVALLFHAAGFAAQPFQFRPRETVVFFGDSITFDGLYCIYTEAFLRTRFPEVEWRFVNAGRANETLADFGEPNASRPFASALARFERDVAAERPTLVIACFGMYDGGFAPFNEARFAKFCEAVKRMIERARKETDARLVILTPPVFDHPGAGQPDERDEAGYGLKSPFVNYDKTLEHYSGWLASLGGRDVIVADAHTHMQLHLRARRRDDPKFTLQPDRVRPNATGHMVMAAVLLRAFGVPALADECVIDAAPLRAVAGRASGLRRAGEGLEFSWESKLPAPRDARWDRRSAAVEGLADKLNRHRLQVTGLPRGEYQLVAERERIAFASAEELAAGLDLLQLKKFPPNERAEQLLVFLDERRKLEHKLKLSAPEKAGEFESERRRVRAIDARLKELSTPAPIAIRVVPANP